MLQCLLDNLALDAALRITSFGVSGALSSASSPAICISETPFFPNFSCWGATIKSAQAREKPDSW